MVWNSQWGWIGFQIPLCCWEETSSPHQGPLSVWNPPHAHSCPTVLCGSSFPGQRVKHKSCSPHLARVWREGHRAEGATWFQHLEVSDTWPPRSNVAVRVGPRMGVDGNPTQYPQIISFQFNWFYQNSFPMVVLPLKAYPLPVTLASLEILSGSVAWIISSLLKSEVPWT